jgi:hypothetical protein
MRLHPLAITAALALAVGGGGCTSDDETSFGRVFGQDFQPVEVAFVGPSDEDTCQFPTEPPTPYSVSAILIGFSSTPGICALAQDPCLGKKSFTFVGGTVAHADLDGAPPGLQPGTYNVYANPALATPDQNLEIRAAVLTPVRTDAVCDETTGLPGSGTIRLDEIGTAQVRGEVDVTFPDGGYLRGSFVASRCETTFDVCEGSPNSCEGVPTCP